MRSAQLWDVPTLARVNVASWRHAYAGLLPDRALRRLSVGDTERRMRRSVVTGRGELQVVHRPGQPAFGFASGGSQRDPSVGYVGEIHELYLHPAAQRQGGGRCLLNAMLWQLADRSLWPVLVWVLADNPARDFYAACGGRQVLASTTESFGKTLPTLGFAWEDYLPLPDLRVR